jgi:hypothetical protein
VTPALLLTRVVVVRSVVGSRRAPATGVVAAFESCMLTMRTERGVGLRPPEKGTGVCCRRSSLVLAPAGKSAGPIIMAVLSEWRVEPGAGGGGRLGSQEG